MNDKTLGLCYRCEERARFYEWGHAARHECGQVAQAVHGCYMYRPVLPHKIAPLDGEKRPIGGPWAFSGRAHSVGLPTPQELELRALNCLTGLVMYYAPPPKTVAKPNTKRHSPQPKTKRTLTKGGQKGGRK